MIDNLTSTDLIESAREFIAGAKPCDEAFNRLALQLFEFQFHSVAPYRRFCEARKLSPSGVEHWTQIPAVPTSGFKELEMTSLSEFERTSVFYSSGTTQQERSRHFHNNKSLRLYETSLICGFRNAVVHRFSTPGVGIISLTPPSKSVPNSSLAHMFATMIQEFGDSESRFFGKLSATGDWEIDFDAAFKVMENDCPFLLLGTAFNFVHLIDHLEAKNIAFELPAGSHALETGGYKGRSRELSKSELHNSISEKLGIHEHNIICEYGMSELSSQAYDCASANRVFLFPHWARAMIVSPETGREVAVGETGLIRIFDLANVNSVMAIQTEDLAIRRDNGFELIGRAKLAEPRGCSLMTA